MDCTFNDARPCCQDRLGLVEDDLGDQTPPIQRSAEDHKLP